MSLNNWTKSNYQRLNKAELIRQYVLPALGYLPDADDRTIDELILNARHTHAIKYQQMEIPGHFDDAYAWFSIDAIVHSYYYCPHTLAQRGTRIWKKCELIFFSSCLLKEERRTDYLEILEPGNLISIKYAHLLALIEHDSKLEKKIRLVSANNERYYHQRNLMLNKPAIERVKQFEKENPLFIKVANKEIIASHVALTRQGYNLQLRKIKHRGNR